MSFNEDAKAARILKNPRRDFIYPLEGNIAYPQHQPFAKRPAPLTSKDSVANQSHHRI